MSLSRLICLNLLFSLMIGLLAAPQAQAQNQYPDRTDPGEDRRVHLQLIPERSEIEPGETLLIAIEQTIYPHWHTYWINPGDSGDAMRLDWSLPDGFTAEALHWPAPEAISVGPLVSYGYEDRAVILQEVTAPHTLPEGPLALDVRIELLVCEDICIPEFATLSLTLNDGRDEDNAAYIDEAWQEMPTEVGAMWDAFYDVDAENRLTIRVDTRQSAMLGTIPDDATLTYMPAEWGITEAGQPQTVAFEDARHLMIQQARGQRGLDEISALPGLLVYTDINGRHTGLAFTALPAPTIDENAAAAPAGTAAGDDSAAPVLGIDPGRAADVGFIQALILALAGGLILNLMPCVFPVLSMKALSLVKMSEQNVAHARLYGLTYTAGILVCFAAIAGLLIALIAAGSQIGWGFQLQNPLIVLGLAWLLFVIGLNLSGLFEISGSFTNVGSGLARREGLTGSFFTGVLAAIVATPCTAPFMGVAIGYALTQPAVQSFSVFLMLGFGLALPFLVLAFVPALRRALPKPGPWMQTFREFLAFPMYASAAWLIWVYALQTDINGVLVALAGMVTIALVIWMFTRAPHNRGGKWSVRVIALLIGLMMVAVTAQYHRDRPAASAAELPANGDTGAQRFTPDRLSEALAGPQPVFVNMTAAWCITCKVNERVALEIPATRALFAEHDMIYFKGDWTNQDPDITAYLQNYGRNGVPIYVYYAPPIDGQRPEPVVLPQILTPAIVREALAF